MKKETVLLILLSAVQFTNVVDFMIIMPLGPQLRHAFGISPQQFSFLVSAYTISAAVTGLVAALFIDRFDRKRALVISFIGFTLGTGACGLAPSFILLLTARILTGAFGGLLSALVLAIIGDAFPLHRRAAAMGTVMGSFSLASIFGVPFGLYLASKLGWHAPFYFLVALALITVPLIFRYVPRLRAHIGKQNAEHPIAALTSILRDGNQLRSLLLMSMLMLGQFMVVPFVAQYMEYNVGFTDEQLTYIYLTGGFFTFFSARLIGKAADRYGRFKVFMTFVLISLIPLFLITNMPRVSIGLVLIATTIFFITSSGRMIPATTMVTATVSPNRRGSFMSVNSCAQNLFEGIGAFVGGSILSMNAKGELTHYWVIGLIAIATSLISIYIASKIRVGGNQQLSLEDELRVAEKRA